MRHLVYEQSESENLLTTDDGIFTAPNYMLALAYALEVFSDIQEFYKLNDETVKEMAKQLMESGQCDMLNGRFMYLIPYDGDPLAIAIAHDSLRVA